MKSRYPVTLPGVVYSSTNLSVKTCPQLASHHYAHFCLRATLVWLTAPVVLTVTKESTQDSGAHAPLGHRKGIVVNTQGLPGIGISIQCSYALFKYLS